MDKNIKLLYLFLFLCTQFFGCIMPPKSPYKEDHVRMNHYIKGIEYRGVSAWKYIFRNKNPRTGEGYPEILKDPTAVKKKKKNK